MDNITMTLDRIDSILYRTKLQREIEYLKLSDDELRQINIIKEKLCIEESYPGLNLLKDEVTENTVDSESKIKEYLNLLKTNDSELERFTYTYLVGAMVDYNCQNIHLINKEDNSDLDFEKLEPFQQSIIRIKIKNHRSKNLTKKIEKHVSCNNMLDSVIKVFVKTVTLRNDIEFQHTKSKI